jgi:hypothetical protein
LLYLLSLSDIFCLLTVGVYGYRCTCSHSITNTNTQSVGLSGRGFGPSQTPLPDNTQRSQETNIHALGRIRTRNPNKRKAADLRLRECDHWVRRSSCISHVMLQALYTFCPRITFCRNAQTKFHAWFKASATKWLRITLFWGIMQWVVVISYRSFGTIYRFHHQGSRIQKDWILEK